MPRIFDCFIFYNELDMLSLRFAELYEHVDFFVLCEAHVTHQGDTKPLFFDENRSRFKDYLDKIIHVVPDNITAEREPSDPFPDREARAWSREYDQRQALQLGLTNAGPDDVIIISDCDEIISRNAINFMRSHSGYFLLDMPMYQFYLNMSAMKSGWKKAFAYSYFLHQEVGNYNLVRTNEMATFNRFAGRSHLIPNAGWHFTFTGGAEQVKKKLAAYTHMSGWQGKMQDDNLLQDQMVALREVGGSKALRFKRIDRSFPVVVQENAQKLRKAGLIKGQHERLEELEELWAKSDSRIRAAERASIEASRVLSLVSEACKKREFRSRNLSTKSLLRKISGIFGTSVSNRGHPRYRDSLTPFIPTWRWSTAGTARPR